MSKSAIAEAKDAFSNLVDRHGLPAALDGLVAYCAQFDQRELAKRLAPVIAWWHRSDDSAG